MAPSELKAARERGFIDVSRDKRSWHLADSWWRECCRTGNVYARITRRRTWASIVVDLLPAGRRLSEQARLQIDGLLRGVCLGLPRGIRVTVVAGAERLYLETVRVADAPILMKQLLRIVEDDLEASAARRLAELAELVT